MRRRKIVFLLYMSFGVLDSYPAQGEVAAYDSMDACISLYKNGEYEKAVDCLTIMQSLNPSPTDEITLFQYLGFSYGMLGRIDQAKQSFNMALGKAPEMQIDTLECPPNISIIFNQVKLERNIAKINSALPLPVVKTPAKRVEVVQKKSPLLPILLMGSGVISAGAGGYYYYSGNTFRDKYHAVDVSDPILLDRYYNDYKNAYIKSGVFFGLTAVLVPVSTYLLLHKAHSEKHISFSDNRGIVSLTYSF